jgi:hypothetical protein
MEPFQKECVYCTSATTRHAATPSTCFLEPKATTTLTDMLRAAMRVVIKTGQGSIQSLGAVATRIGRDSSRSLFCADQNKVALS